jgi:hypothetical protein
MESSKNYCRECGSELAGRSDKKYCDDYCRSKFHNRANSQQNKLMYDVNRILRKNRSILEQFLIFDAANTSREAMLKMGFDFTYFTSQVTLKTGEVYRFCYDLGYFVQNQNDYQIVQRSAIANYVG